MFDPIGIDSTEAELIEEAGGDSWDTYDEWADLAERGGTRAFRALLWVCLRRKDPTLDFDSVVYRRNELSGEIVEDEPVGKGEPVDSDTGST